MRRWPTPKVSDGEHAGPKQRGSKGDLSLSAAVNPPRLLPTPAAETCLEQTRQEAGPPQLHLFPEGSPASRSATPGSAEARQMTATSGQRCSELCRNSGPLGLLVRMLTGSSLWRSESAMLGWRPVVCHGQRYTTYSREYTHDRAECSSQTSLKTLKVRGTGRQHLCFRLVASVPRIAATASSLWPTATTDSVSGRQERCEQGGMPLTAAVAEAEAEAEAEEGRLRLWQTPTGQDVKPGSAEARRQWEEEGQTTHCRLRNQVHPPMWRTPNTMDALEPKSQEALAHEIEHRPGRAEPNNLRDQVAVREGSRQWPTPKSSRSGSDYARAMRQDSGGDDLVTAVVRTRLLPTPRRSEFKGCGPLGGPSHDHRLERRYLDATIQEMEQETGFLNPDWVEALMGFPIGWTVGPGPQPTPTGNTSGSQLDS